MKTVITLVLVLSAVVAALPSVQAQWPLGGEKMQLKTEPSPTVTVNGRFQIFTSPHEKGDTFMLDTDTGRIWLLKKDKTSGEYTFKRIRVEEVDSTPPERRGKDKPKQKIKQPVKDNRTSE